MFKLSTASLLWAFSFPLMGNYIVGHFDIYLAMTLRVVLGMLIFLPMANLKIAFNKKAALLVLVGVLEGGVMYLFYFNAYKYLSVSEVAIFTTTTPIYIYLLSCLKHNRWQAKSLFAVFGSIAGAVIISYQSLSQNFWLGFLLLQLANISFGLGQLLYKYVQTSQGKGEKSEFYLMYLGALLVLIPATALFGSFNFPSKLPTSSLIAMLWLGIGASGIAIYLWNSALKNVADHTVAVMNNLVIPLAVGVNLLFWGADIAPSSFIPGATLILISIYYQKRLETKFESKEIALANE